jgi:hypothetical protein
MDHLLSGKPPARMHWTEYFDVVIVRAEKPGFFLKRTTGQPVELREVFSPAGEGTIWSGGGVRDLEHRLGCHGDRILYFGDHTYGDILKSKKVCLWRTAMIVHELEREMRILEHLAVPLRLLRRRLAARDRLERIRDYLLRRANGVHPRRRDTITLTGSQALSMLAPLQKRIDRHEQAIELLESFCDRAHNPTWGPTLRTEHEPSYFAAQVRSFACIYTGRVSNFLLYPVDKYFQVRAEVMPHERA